MATIYREFQVNAPADFVWAAYLDIGAIHARLARGFVSDTVLVGETRTVTFANGFVVDERIVAIDDEHRRLAYSATGGKATHHNASFQVFAEPDGKSRVLWITDLLPDDVREQIAQMVDFGIVAMQRTLEQTFAGAA
jgi:hypothetical protein